MNALAQTYFESEGLVAANESVIEERLKALREDLGEVKDDVKDLRTYVHHRMNGFDADLRSLRDRFDKKTDALAEDNKEIRKEMAQGFERQNARNEQRHDILAAECRDIRKDMATGFEKVNLRINDLGRDMASLKSMMKVLVILVGAAASLATLGTFVGKLLNWF